MTTSQLWFGVVNGSRNYFQWVPQPELPVGVHRDGHLETMDFENGGISVARSSAYHRVFEFNFPIETASGTEGLGLYADFAGGFYGDGMNYFADPMQFAQNLCPPHWASPALAELDWPDPSTGAVVWADTAANSFRQPPRKGTWTITTAANATPLTDSTIPYFIIPIPPTHTLYFGATGAKTGTAQVTVEGWVNGATSAGLTGGTPFQTETGSTRLFSTVAGATYAFAKVFINRTSSAASTITPISMMAQLWPAAVTPTLTGNHVPGRGHTGLKFADDAAPENYAAVNGGTPYQGLSTRLIEVGAWV